MSREVWETVFEQEQKRIEEWLSSLMTNVQEVIGEHQAQLQSQDATIAERDQRIAGLEAALQEVKAELEALPSLDQLKDQEELTKWREALEEQDAELQKRSQKLDETEESKDLKKVRARLQKRGDELAQVRRELRDKGKEVTQLYLQASKLEKKVEEVEGERDSIKRTLHLKLDASNINTDMINGITAMQELVARIQQRGILLTEEEVALEGKAREIMANLLVPKAG